MTVAVLEETSVASRVQSLDWARLAADLDAHGCAVMPGILSPAACRALAAPRPLLASPEYRGGKRLPRSPGSRLRSTISRP